LEVPRVIPRVVKSAVKAGLRAFGYQLVPNAARLETAGVPSYNADSLTVYGKNVEFLHDPKFVAAYRRGMNSGHCIGRPPGSDLDIHIEWRVAVCCWAARHAAKLKGDFVECGVNTGIFSLAVCEYVDLNSLDKSFYLFDTFEGIPLGQMSEKEKSIRNIPLGPDGESVVSSKHNEMYPQCYEMAARNFSPFPRARLVRGTVPESLSSVNIENVAYLSIDMNIAYPERAAIERFWPKLSSGAIVVLDDYAWQGHAEQKASLDEFTRVVGVEILTLPTGQGLIIKP
jgi:O-methyltransferase